MEETPPVSCLLPPVSWFYDRAENDTVLQGDRLKLRKAGHDLPPCAWIFPRPIHNRQFSGFTLAKRWLQCLPI
jgi:hypothetical protein